MVPIRLTCLTNCPFSWLWRLLVFRPLVSTESPFGQTVNMQIADEECFGWIMEIKPYICEPQYLNLAASQMVMVEVSRGQWVQWNVWLSQINHLWQMHKHVGTLTSQSIMMLIISTNLNYYSALLHPNEFFVTLYIPHSSSVRLFAGSLLAWFQPWLAVWQKIID